MKLTNAQTRPLVAKALGIQPKELMGWIVIGLTHEGDTLVGSNATNRDWITDVVKSVADQLPDSEEV